MTTQVLTQLEEKIELALETIELLRMQVEELEKKNEGLQTERDSMLGKQSEFETSIASLLDKLKAIDEGQVSKTALATEEIAY